MAIRVRAALVEAPTMLVNSVRGLAKSYGDRLPMCHADQMDEDLLEELGEPLGPALAPPLAQVRTLTKQIHGYDRQV